MDRRMFLGTLAGGLLAAPLAAQAQPAGKVPRIGYLWAGAVGSDGTTIEGLRQGLRELGYVEGQSIAIESRYGDGRLDRLPRLLHELIDLRVDVLVTPGTPVTAAAKRETRAIPIVSLSGDPLGSGFVESLARPGGNITGLSLATGEAFGGKWLELVKEVVPRAASVIMIWNPTNLASADNVRQVERVAGGLGLRVSAYAVRSPEDLDRTFTLAVRDRVSACTRTPTR